MQVRIGIIAPSDSMDNIILVAKEFSQVKLIPYIYSDLNEIDGIIMEAKSTIDLWLFSGIMNYTYALKKNLITNVEASYPLLNGSSFFGTLLEAQIAEKRVISKISIDNFSNEEISKNLSFYNLDSLEYYNTPFSGDGNMDDILSFHKKLYNSGKTELVITTVKSIYYDLKKENIPVYRVTPSYLSIRLTIQLLIERAQSNHYRKSQMAIVGFRADFDASKKDQLYYTYKMKHNDLEIERALLVFAEKSNGSLITLGDGLFFVFTTRGEVDGNIENELFPLMDDLEAQTAMRLKISIGFGETVLESEQNVRDGLRNIKEAHENVILIVDENKTFTFKQKNQQSLSYNTLKQGEIWKDGKNKAKISPGIASKVKAFSNQYNKSEFTSQDISRWLRSTERNGARVINELKKAKIIEQSGESQSGQRGRPRKVYRFTDDNS